MGGLTFYLTLAREGEGREGEGRGRVRDEEGGGGEGGGRREELEAILTMCLFC